jgi:hypothetical protein
MLSPASRASGFTPFAGFGFTPFAGFGFTPFAGFGFTPFAGFGCASVLLSRFLYSSTEVFP